LGSTTCSIGADRAARAALNWKARERRFHFRQVGVSLGSLRGWVQHRGVSLAHPESLRVLAADWVYGLPVVGGTVCRFPGE
jgi:hypothetical protein